MMPLLQLSYSDVITFENEFVNLEALLPLAQQGVCFRPDYMCCLRF